MKRFFALMSALAFALICSVTAGAEESSYTLTPNTVSEWEVLSGTGITYMPEQKIYSVSGSMELEIEVSGGVYLYCDMGGFGHYDNGAGSGSNISYICYNEVGAVTEPYPVVQTVPSDGKFHRAQIGTAEMLAGIPDDVHSIRLSITADKNHYIKGLYIYSSDMGARDMSAFSWSDAGNGGNIEPNASRATYWIMVGGVLAAALIMFGIRKWKDSIRKGK